MEEIKFKIGDKVRFLEDRMINDKIPCPLCDGVHSVSLLGITFQNVENSYRLTCPYCDQNGNIKIKRIPKNNEKVLCNDIYEICEIRILQNKIIYGLSSNRNQIFTIYKNENELIKEKEN